MKFAIPSLTTSSLRYDFKTTSRAFFTYDRLMPCNAPRPLLCLLPVRVIGSYLFDSSLFGCLAANAFFSLLQTLCRLLFDITWEASDCFYGHAVWVALWMYALFFFCCCRHRAGRWMSILG